MNSFHKVELLHEGRVVCIRRSERPFESAAELRQERFRLVEQLNTLGRSGRGLLIDSRAAPHSTEASMKDEFERFRTEVARGYALVAILVRTKVGILQVRRLGAAQSAVVAFDDEAAAVNYLLGDAPRSSGPRSSGPR
jgi:hypothetical protein